jgi:hypothetical protein
LITPALGAISAWKIQTFLSLDATKKYKSIWLDLEGVMASRRATAGLLDIRRKETLSLRTVNDGI